MCWRMNYNKDVGKFLNIYIYIWYNFAGLKYIQELAGQGSTEIRLDMTSSDSRTGHETCPDFKLTEGTNYKMYTLNIGSCTGVGIESNIFMVLFYYIFVYMYLAKWKHNRYKTNKKVSGWQKVQYVAKINSFFHRNVFGLENWNSDD
jgi:hypothetical protein